MDRELARIDLLLESKKYTVLTDDDHGYGSHDFDAKPGEQALTLLRREFETIKVALGDSEVIAKLSMGGVGHALRPISRYSYSHWYDRNFLRFKEARPDADGELTLRYVPIYNLDETLHLQLTGPQPNAVKIPLYPQ